MDPAASFSPARERIEALDVLRGVAVAGILFANVLVFFGPFVLPADRAAALPSVAADNVALFLERVLVEGKFYSVFSLLFGICFGLQLARGGAPVGRMALTNYLMHSIVCVVLSYGFGLALWWRVGASRAMAIAAAIVLVQIPLSAWWFSRFRFGPVEWIWRLLTYGRPL